MVGANWGEKQEDEGRVAEGPPVLPGAVAAASGAGGGMVSVCGEGQAGRSCSGGWWLSYCEMP